MKLTEFRSGDTAPEAGSYEELNVFGTRTGQVIVMTSGETFPATPRGFSWRPLSALSVTQLRERASEYRAMARTATTEKVRQSLLKLADCFDALAARRDGGRLALLVSLKEPAAP